MNDLRWLNILPCENGTSARVGGPAEDIIADSEARFRYETQEERERDLPTIVVAGRTDTLLFVFRWLLQAF
jgi:hypothetical protein